MFTNLSLVLLLLLASSLVPKFPLVSYISFKLEAFSWLNITRIGSELSKMAASAYFPVWKSLRGFCITWLYFLVSGEIFCVNCFRPISTGNPMNLLAIPYSIISVKLEVQSCFSLSYTSPLHLSKSIGAAANRKVHDWKCYLTAVISYDNFTQENLNCDSLVSVTRTWL